MQKVFTAEITLRSVEQVKDFVREAEKRPFDIDLSHGRYVVDGKSLMGIISLDLAKPIAMSMHADSEEEALKFIDDIRLYRIEVVM